MRKLYSLIRACMSSDMSLFKIKRKKNSKLSNILIPLFIALYLMFMIWGGANSLFEKLTPLNMQFLLISQFVFATSIMTIVEGIYKTGSLVFNCKDDDLLLSLPIKRSTVLFVRVFKFYVFELVFNSLFLLPVMIAYIRWGTNITWTYYLTSFIMILLLPIIPIVISLLVGAIISSLSSRFKYKNVVQIAISMIFLLGILILSFNSEGIVNYLIKHATDINDLITKIYYPAGAYTKLILNFKVLDLLIFIIINIGVFAISIAILGKFYFKINSRLKKSISNKKVKVDNMVIRSRGVYHSLVKKELNMFFKTPVFIVNAGFALVLFIALSIAMCIKFDKFFPLIASSGIFNMTEDTILSNTSILILMLVIATSFMTSITNSVISLEGRNINILKSLPVSGKTILMSKIYSSLVITTPVLFIGNIILFIKFKTSIIEMVLLIILSIIVPLISHFIGLIVNLKFPKLDAVNSTEVVKQSISSFVAVIIGMVLLIISMMAIIKVIGVIDSIFILSITTGLYLIIDIVLYVYLIKFGVKDFNNLTI